MFMKENTELSKNKIVRIFQTILIVLMTIFTVGSIAASSTIIFHNTYYDTFWVNGQSMYPTLNLNAKRSDGELIGYGRSEGHEPNSQPGDYDIDYGYMDCHKSVIDSLERFDIVVFMLDPTAQNPKRRIKRIFGLPGETIYFISGGDNNGDFYVKHNEESDFELAEQKFISTELVRQGEYPSQQYTLKENEYFLVGDNRKVGASTDSRVEGPYKREQLEGKAIGLEGSCTYSSEGIKNIKHHWPRRLR